MGISVRGRPPLFAGIAVELLSNERQRLAEPGLQPRGSDLFTCLARVYLNGLCGVAIEPGKWVVERDTTVSPASQRELLLPRYRYYVCHDRHAYGRHGVTPPC